MNHEIFTLGCLIIQTVIDCKTLVYYCNFDTGLVDDCIFDKSTGVFGLNTTSGIRSTYLKPTEPLSDVTSIRKKISVKNLSLYISFNL